MTLRDALIRSVTRAGEYNRDDQVAPAVVLWPDKERQWEVVIPLLRTRVPLNDLPDGLITKINILYYTDSREALLKAVVE